MNARLNALKVLAVPMLAMATLLFSGPATATPKPDPAQSRAAELASLYWQGHAALGEGDWDLALQQFQNLEQQLRESEPTVADAAIYWQAYALSRAGRYTATRETVERLGREFPESRWNDDAARLLRRSKGAAGNGTYDAANVDPSLVQMMSLPPAQAIPELVAILQWEPSLQIRKRALFVLSQMDDPGAVAQIVAAARGRDPELRAEAVRLLGLINATDEFREVYAAALDEKIKRQVINAMGVAGADAILIEVARSDADQDLRRRAVEALGISGSVEALAEIAGSDIDLDLRHAAIRALGVANGTQALLALYPETADDSALRMEVLKSLLVAADEIVLFELLDRAATAEEKQIISLALQQAGYDPNASTSSRETDEQESNP